MNHDKAREFFSAYYEGTLDGGLRQSLEAKLKADADLQSDYAAFVETVEELNALKSEEIEIPIFLSDRIATRLEQVQTDRKTGFETWALWLRGVTVAGLGAAAILFAIPFVKGNHSASNAGAISSGATQDEINFKTEGSKLMLQYQASGTKTIVVSSPSTGKEIQRFSLNGQKIESPIENSLSNGVLFKIEAVGDKNSRMIAVPGSSLDKTRTGSGSIQDLAVAIAGHYRIPVVVDASDVTRHVSWSFSSPDARSAASQALKTEGYSVDQRQEGMLQIMDR